MATDEPDYRSPDVALDGSIKRDESSDQDDDERRAVSIPTPSVPSLESMLIRVRGLLFIPLFVAASALILGGLYLGWISHTYFALDVMDVHGYTFTPIEAGYIYLRPDQVVGVVGVLMALSGVTIVFKLTSGPNPAGVWI